MFKPKYCSVFVTGQTLHLPDSYKHIRPSPWFSHVDSPLSASNVDIVLDILGCYGWEGKHFLLLDRPPLLSFLSQIYRYGSRTVPSLDKFKLQNASLFRSYWHHISRPWGYIHLNFFLNRQILYQFWPSGGDRFHLFFFLKEKLFHFFSSPWEEDFIWFQNWENYIS